MLSNSPFIRYKAETFEGGMHTMAFVSYPNVTKGGKYDCVTAGMDIAPTILEMAGITYPADQEPMDGVSMAPIFTGDTTTCPDRSIAFEMDSILLVRKGDWKVGQRWDVAHNRWDSMVYLFNLKEDPFEQNNLAWTYPDKYNELMTIYRTFADKNKVIPVGYRVFGGGALLDPFTNLEQPVQNAIISGGVQINYANMLHNTTATAKVGDIVDIAAEIYPAPDHIGQKGEVLVVAYAAPEGEPARYVAFSGYDEPQSALGNRGWDGSLETLPVYMDFTGKMGPKLPRLIEIPIYEGEINRPGTYQFWIGYRLLDGTLISNFQKTVTLTVEGK